MRSALMGALVALVCAACAQSADQVQCKLKTQGDHGPNEVGYQVCMSKKDHEHRLDDQHERDVEACAQHGARPACHRAGMKDEAGNRTRALREYEAACGDDLPEACYRAAVMLRGTATSMARSPADGAPPTASTMQEVARLLARAHRYLEQACRMRAPQSCDELARPPLAP